MSRVIPVYQPNIGPSEIRYVNECLTSGWISSRGGFIQKFEEKFAETVGVEFASTTSNGTTALHLAMLSLNIGQGDEVICPTFTYVASANAIRYVGGEPIFVDADIETWQLDCDQIEKCITEKTKAIIAVHLYGGLVDLPRLKDICTKHKIHLIEDCAEAFGSKVLDKHAGTYGDVSTFSFFGNKTITTGEGGMVVSNSRNIIDRINLLKNQAVSKTKEYWHDELGYNYRMTNIAAAIGLAQVERAEEIIQKKQSINSLYESFLEGSAVKFQKNGANVFNSHWMVSILFAEPKIRDEIRQILKNNNVETRPLFTPMHLMPIYNNNQNFLVSEYISTRGINVPSYENLSDEDIKFICSLIKKHL